MLRRNLILSALATPVVGGFGPAFAQEDKSDDMAPIEVKEMFLGDENAPVELIEYASFTCPHCATFHTQVFPLLKAQYIDTGKVKFVTREVYFDRLGLWGAMLARCGDGSKYFGISDMLYKRQREWTQGDGGAVIAENLKKIGKIAGFDEETVDACLQDRPTAEAMLERFKETTAEHGVQSTPTLVINGVTHSNMGFEALAKLLDEAAG
ncbi:hypothetical protein GCM10007939_19290 [Amylibacter marinus]|uniref:Thioredoxin domain-containing protein n=1 Tax=Amylibacter marinus TaxID=1475483 RepID=A0ABQ5VWP1_9RHOB|nr:DsbA family protein [Amylibacter marinus]GLQ35646.1 hypothetical protein GCM10007939_19290 [Amylibacter marinus]